jgi:chaperonin GroEL (HSP60 family)
MIKQVMTPERKARIIKSVTFMAMMAELIKMEHLVDMDVRFKNPLVNQFASRISKDAEAIRTNLLTNDRVSVQMINEDFTEEYTAELYRIFHFFIGLPIDQIRGVMDNLYAVSEAIED